MNPIPRALLADPSFRIYAICAVVLTAKMISLAFFTAFARWRLGAYVNPEDGRLHKAEKRQIEHPLVARSLRAHRNDLENILVFFAIGLIFVLSGGSAEAARWYFITFTIARILHTVFYLFSRQPWRSLSYFVALLCLAGMGTQIVMRVLGSP